MVVLNPSTSALEAGRALENNDIGAAVVQDKGRLVGIVTDRDLAARVVGRGLDPKTTTLAEVMTTAVATLSPSDRQDAAIRLMQERRIRRIPLVEAERIVGIVTLDDLLLDEAAPLDELAAVVEAQIGAGGPATPIRAPALRRRAARADATYARLIGRLRDTAPLLTPEQAETALEVVVSSLVRRLTPDEAKDLIAQLPLVLQLRVEVLRPGPDELITRETIIAQLSRRLQVDSTRAAELFAAVGSTIAESVSSGQMEDVRSQLPEDLRAVFSIAPLAAAA